MELRVLGYFLAIAREENFTKAAARLHITQPTLSRKIAALEEELGVKLFLRSNHNILLTEEGMMLKRRAGEILSLAEKTKKDFMHREKELVGTISIGGGEFLSTKLLTDCIAAFSKKHPAVEYEFLSGNASNISDYIERGLVDIGLMNRPVDIRKYDFVSMPVEEQWGVLVRPDHALAQKDSIKPEDLAGCSLIGPMEISRSTMVGRWLGDVRDSVNLMARGNLLYNEAMMAESGLGVVVGIKLNYSFDNLKFIPLSPPLSSTTALAWKKDRVFSAATGAFIDFCKKYLKGITDDKI